MPQNPCWRVFGALVALMLAGGTVAAAGLETDPPLEQPLPRDSCRYLAQLQDSQMSGLVPLLLAQNYTSTYVNAVVAVAFVLCNQPERARRIFDAFASRSSECPCACGQGFQQNRDAATGGPDPTSDCWLGDNAWLLTAVKSYRERTGDHRYDPLIEQLKGWLQCLKSHSPEPGIIGGHRPAQACAIIPPHAEGSIDVVGATHGLGVEALRTSVKQWIDREVWIPRGDCFDRGPTNLGNLPTDHCSWGFLALGVERPQYACILGYADGLTARTQDRYLLERWDRDGRWHIDREHPSIQVQLGRVPNGDGHDMEVTFTIPAGQSWFRIYRHEGVDLAITPGFSYHVAVEAAGNVPQFEIKLSQKETGYTCISTRALAAGWQQVEVAYEQLRDFATGGPCVGLDRIGQIEFAVNSGRVDALDRRIRIGSIRYRDPGKPRLWPVHGFAGFQSERDGLFVEGTGQMATAYCAAGRLMDWTRQMEELLHIAQWARDGYMALPEPLTGAVDPPSPANPVATSWLLIASQCFNPFHP
jgi:hypothetical protein